jgi:hypothetical protein
LKKVEAELDEAEEIVSPSSSLAGHQGSTQVKHSSFDQPSTDLTDGDRTPIHASEYPDALSDEVSE